MKKLLVRLTTRALFYLSRKRAAALMAVKVRNQCQLLIGRYLGFTSDTKSNGELLVLDTLASDCKTFVDVGANVGNWTQAFVQRNPNALGYLVEPSKQCLEKLRLKFPSSKYRHFDCALADFTGEADYMEESDCGETSALAVCHEALKLNVTRRKVNVSTLDQLFADQQDPLDFIKIDAEGADLLVVKGASRLMSNNRIRFIQFEYNTNWTKNGASLHVMNELLKANDFSVFIIRFDGLYELDEALWGEYFFFSNFLACSNAHLDLIEPIRKGSL